MLQQQIICTSEQSPAPSHQYIQLMVQLNMVKDLWGKDIAIGVQILSIHNTWHSHMILLNIRERYY